MPNQIETAYISYTCPNCSRRYEKELSFVPSNKKLKIEKGWWCPYCNVTISIIYQLSRTRYNNLNLKVLQFICNEKQYRKRFSLFEKKEKTR